MFHGLKINWEEDNRALIPVPLTTAYEFPSYSRLNPAVRKITEDFIAACALCDGAPTWSDKKTPSGMELFYRITEQPGYYPYEADRTIFAQLRQDKPDFFQDLFRGKVLVEVCAGDMRKTVELLQKLPKENWPERIYVNDIVESNITAAAARLRRIGYPGKNIIRAPGNIQDENFWNVLALKLDKDPALVLLQGATFNDFIVEGEAPFLGQFHKLAKGSRFFVSGDNTVDDKTLHDAYVDNAPLRHFIVAAVVQHFNTRLRLVDPRKEPIRLSLSSIEQNPSILLAQDIGRPQPIVSVERDSDKTGASRRIVLSAETDQYVAPLVDSISKPSETAMRGLFARYGHDILERIPLRSEKHPGVDYSIYLTECRV